MSTTARPSVRAIALLCAAAHVAAVLCARHGLSLAPLAVGLVVALGVSFALALAGLASWRPCATALLISLAVLLAWPRAGPPDEPPVDTPLVLSGAVVEVSATGPRAARIVLAEAEASMGPDSWQLERPIATTFDYLEVSPPIGAVIRCDAMLARPRQPWNPTTVPRDRPPLFATAWTQPTRVDGAPSWSTAAAIAVRERLTFESASATALFRALILGERSALDPATRYAYQDTGTAHLLAISGMNLALLGWGLFRVLLWLAVRASTWPGARAIGLVRLVQGHRPRVFAAVLALAATAAYTSLIAPSDATDRALAALALTFVAVVFDRSAGAGRVLVMCLVGAALIDPEVLLHAGFQLSFAATASLVVIAPHVARLRPWLRDRIRSPLARGLALALASLVLADIACFLATAPLTVAWFGQLPTHSLWVNLVAIPFMSLLVFPAGIVWLAIATVVPPLGDALAPALAALGDAFNAFIRACGDVSGSASTEAWPLALGVVACLALLALMSARRAALRLGSAALIATTAGAWACVSPSAGLTLTVLDVGHGDALALRLPDGTRVLVDTGGKADHRGAPGDVVGRDPNRLLAERVLVPALRANGFAAIDLLVLTHADLDHIGAAAALAERIPIRHLWLGPCNRAPAIDQLLTHLTADRAVHPVARAPPITWGGVELELLSPDEDLERSDGRCAVHDNDASLVLRITYAGRTLLLTGDIEADSEASLLARYAPEHLKADVLKVPHHGSRTSSTEAFLDVVRPTFAIVPGLDRKRAPPHPSILARYRERGIATYLTGSRGATTVHIDPDGTLEVEALR